MLGKIKVLSLLVIVSAFLMSIPFAVCANASSEYEGGLYSYQLAKIIQVPGRQGIATDGTYYYKWKVQNITQENGLFSANTTQRTWILDASNPVITINDNSVIVKEIMP